MKVTVPEVLPLPPDVMVSQPAPLEDVNGQPLGFATASVPVSPAAGKPCFESTIVGDSATV